jgi:lysosomal acid lipase/cholesteryl ester hydrolase
VPGNNNETFKDAIRNVEVLKREPVLLMHGVLGSSDGFALNGPELSPLYMIVKTGKYDIWLMNARGNTYSRYHTSLDPDTEAEFWNFSFEEIAKYDLTTSIDFILSTTKRSKLSLVGFSQGTTIGFCGLSMNSAYFNAKVKIFIALAPVISLKYSSEGFL